MSLNFVNKKINIKKSFTFVLSNLTQINLIGVQSIFENQLF